MWYWQLSILCQMHMQCIAHVCNKMIYHPDPELDRNWACTPSPRMQRKIRENEWINK